jgi:hypothetical protein
LHEEPDELLLFFDAVSGTQIDFDLRGDLATILARLESHSYFARSDGAQSGETKINQTAGPGRPRLGVTSREVTLLPRHWQWLAQQPGGISVTLRKLVESASQRIDPEAVQKKRNEAATRFMGAIAGDLPGYESACRAIYANDDASLREVLATWPAGLAQAVSTLLAKDAH